MEKSFFRMLYSDCAIFDRNSNNTKILANEAYFENLISFYENDENDLSTLDLLHSQKYSDYTEELEVLANFLLKQIVFKSCTY